MRKKVESLRQLEDRIAYAVTYLNGINSAIVNGEYDDSDIEDFDKLTKKLVAVEDAVTELENTVYGEV